MSRIEPQKPHITTQKTDAANTDREEFEKLEKVLDLKENVQKVLQEGGFFKPTFMVFAERDMKSHDVALGKIPGSAKRAASKADQTAEDFRLHSPTSKKRKTH